MSSRIAEAPAGEAGWRSRFGGRSITAHIARFYTLSAVILLAIIVGVLQWVETRSLRADNARFLADKVQQLRMIVQQHPEDSTFLEQEVKAEGGAYAADLHYLVYSRVLDHAGKVLVETPGIESILPPRLFPPPRDYVEAAQKAELKNGTDGRCYLLATAWGEAAPGPAGRRIIQVAMDTEDAENFMTFYQRGSIAVAIFGVLVSAYIGLLIARSSMRPLGDITRVMDQITATQLHQRLQPERWPLELATLAQAFDRMLGRLDDSHTRLAQFSADLAHELRTPINALMGQTEVALTKARQPEEYRQILESNLEEYHRLARMINELLFLARADDPKMRIERRWLDARRELDAVRDFHEALAEDHGVTVSCQGQADIYADPTLIRRAMTNLLSNALRHTPRGGHIVLAVEPLGDGGAVFRVSDTGYGIRREDLPRIFDRFCRPDEGANLHAEGAGLGLAIVHSIAELHGGTALIASTLGQGTTVTLRFPAPPDGGA